MTMAVHTTLSAKIRCVVADTDNTTVSRHAGSVDRAVICEDLEVSIFSGKNKKGGK